MEFSYSVWTAGVVLSEGADLALLDATYSPEEYSRFAGFGHSTWDKCGSLCVKAGAKRWGMFHHMHLRTDGEQRVMETAARGAYPNTFAARQGQRIALPKLTQT